MFLTRKQLIFRFIHRVTIAVVSAVITFSFYMLLFFVFIAAN